MLHKQIKHSEGIDDDSRLCGQVGEGGSLKAMASA